MASLVSQGRQQGRQKAIGQEGVGKRGEVNFGGRPLPSVPSEELDKKTNYDKQVVNLHHLLS